MQDVIRCVRVRVCSRASVDRQRRYGGLIRDRYEVMKEYVNCVRL